MNSIAVSIILWIATISGMKTMPDVSQAWRTLNAWTAGMEHPVFVATSKSIVDECKRKPGSYLVLPLLLYGAHEILLDNKHVRYYGDPKFNKANVVMNYPFIRCDEIDHGKEITWVAHSYSPYFARFLSWPIVINDRPYNDLFCRYIYIGSVFCLLIISVFSFLIMSGKENKRTLYSFCASSILMSIYFAFSVTPLLNIEMSPILANKISDSSLTVGFTLLLLSFFLDRVLNKYIFLTHLILSVIAVTIHTMANSGDAVQLGSSLTFPTGTLAMGYIFVKTLIDKEDRWSGQYYSRLICSFVFLTTTFYEMLLFSGEIESFSIFPVGIVFGYLAFIFGVERRIAKTYRERDDLLVNLNERVKEKTSELNDALNSLSMSQKEIMQSTQMATLGIISASINHEINNSILYINDTLESLDKNINITTLGENEKEGIFKHVNSMKHGLKTIMGIIDTVKRYANPQDNQQENTKINLMEPLTTVTNILGRKMEKYKVESNINESVFVIANKVGLIQILLNLTNNALDSMSEGGRLKYSCSNESNYVRLEVSDSGSGITEENLKKIFKPLFTTKDSGKGTGLGLYIVKKEVMKLGGELEVVSELGVGTTFIVKLPRA